MTQAKPAPLDVVTMGETMALLVADDIAQLKDVARFTKRLAGADTNVAIGLARLGLKVGWISRLGADSFGDYVRHSVAAEGIDISRVETDATRSTGFMLKARAAAGEDPAIEYYRRGSAASLLSLEQFDEAYITDSRHFHATGITPALSPASAELVEHAMRTQRNRQHSVSFDPNLRPSLWPNEATMRTTLNRLAGNADWVMPGIAEGRLLTGRDTPYDIAGFYLDQGAQAVIIKLGKEGAYVRTATEQIEAAGVPVAHVIDTVGAGDGFAVGIISARLEGYDWARASARGNWIAAQAIQTIGDMEGLPLRAALPAHL
ncbi:sugar kinase [Herbaspirillum autotrophicum]|uniref:sugar kinase n=1 Tax=Herbaspirillum autotrophicum TaxID=180195 RepID=UPI00067D568E|nr:sugar kinase [Herbaspirillum autotrophicum]